MNNQRTLSVLLGVALCVVVVLGAVPLNVGTPLGTVSTIPQIAEAKALNTVANRPAYLRADPARLQQSFSVNRTSYTIALKEGEASVKVSLGRQNTSAFTRSRVQKSDGSWGSWQAWVQKNRARNVSVGNGKQRKVQFQIRDAKKNTRTITVTISRAKATTAPTNPTPPSPKPPVNAVPTFTFSGTGYGHGLGLSQNGAMQQAREGRTYTQILKHYFTDITLADRVPTANMRVNLDASLGNRATWTIAPRDGSAGAAMLIGSKSFTGANGPYTFSVVNGTIRMTPAVGTAVDFGSSVKITSNGSADNRLLTVMDQSGPPLPTNSFRFVRYRGTLELTVVNGKLRLVNELPMQEYLYGVVPRETPTSVAVAAAVEAQAVSARSYAYGQTGTAAGVASTVAFQVYGGHSRFASEANWRAGTPVTALENPVSNAAVNSTGNKVILYNGAIVRTYYSACNGNQTANSEDVWSSKLGYLRSVPDPYCARSGHANHSWTVTMTGMELAQSLKDRGASVPNGAGKTVYVTKLDTQKATGGWVKVLTIYWSDGSKTSISNADNVRIRMGFKSANFVVKTS